MWVCRPMYVCMYLCFPRLSNMRTERGIFAIVRTDWPWKHANDLTLVPYCFGVGYTVPYSQLAKHDNSIRHINEPIAPAKSTALTGVPLLRKWVGNREIIRQLLSETHFLEQYWLALHWQLLARERLRMLDHAIANGHRFKRRNASHHAIQRCYYFLK